MKRPQNRGVLLPATLAPSQRLLSRGLFAALLLMACTLTLQSPAVVLAACPDNDKDNYAACTNCTPDEGQVCGDCNDGNASVNPGAAEICGNDVDDNCDGELLEPGDPCIVTGEGFCPTQSISVCSADNLSLDCPIPSTGLDTPEPETSSIPDSCFDEVDNDCDGLIDAEDEGCGPVAEKCDGFDNDLDGSVDEGFSFVDTAGVNRGLGDPCGVGVGVCQRTGTVICAQNGQSAVCSASPGAAFDETASIGGRCSDGLDNDCDGLVDLSDPSCQGNEICDGLDNDGDGLIDEDFSNLGQTCVEGLGACQSQGVVVCSPSRTATVCSAVPSLSDFEGPSGPTCEDGVDNDCDGFTDTTDPDCSSADFAIACSIPYYQLRWWPGWNSCAGVHRLLYTTNVDLEENPDVSLTAELLALDTNGTILDAIPVDNWDLANLASRKDREDWVVDTDGPGSGHKVFAPVPMLRVTLDDGKNKRQAFCSNIPYIQILEPKGKVVTESDGDTTRLFAITTLVDPKSIEAIVDGVSIFPALGISDPSICTPDAPCNGTVTINGNSVDISDLSVQVSSVWLPGQNTLDMKIGNLGCGGHIFKVNGIRKRNSFPNNPDEQCVVDNLADKGDSSGLSIELASPGDFEVIESAPVQVTGVACSGRPIAGVSVNGKVVDVAGQTVVEGDGETIGDKYEVAIDTDLAETNLAQDVATGDTRLGTVDMGSNRISANVIDDLGNRAFDDVLFAVGDVLPPATSAEIKAQIEEQLRPALEQTYEELKNSATSQIENAFVVGLSEKAVDTVFNKVCFDAAEEFKARLEDNFRGMDLGSFTADPDCSCKVTAQLRIQSITFTGQGSCDADLKEGQIDVQFDLPNVEIVIVAKRTCKTTGLFGECLAKTIIDVEAKTIINDPVFKFTITEEQIETSTPPGDDMKTFVIGSLRYPGSNGESLENSSEVWDNDSDIDCWGAAVCSFFEGVAGFLINVFTFGFVEATDVFDFISFEFDLVDFEAIAGSSEPDPIGITGLQVDKQEVEAYEQRLEGILSDVKIRPEGLTAGLRGSFEVLRVDPEIAETPGAVLTPAGLPLAPVPGAGDLMFALADDTFNQLLASETIAGRLKTSCVPTGRTLSDLIPLDCSTLSVGECSNDETLSCQEDAECGGGVCVENNLKSIAYRGSCVAFQGGNCNALPFAERVVCKVTETKLAQINILPSQPLLFCTKADIPPRLLIQDDGGTLDVETTVRLNDVSVALVVDRDENGQLDGDLVSTRKCLAEGAPTVGDCSFFAACLDLNLESAMKVASKACEADQSVLCSTDTDCALVGGGCIEVCESNKPGIVTRITSVVPTLRASGVVCGGGVVTGDDDLLANTAGEDDTIDLLRDQATRFTPPACIEGVDLGGLVQFKNPRLISVETDGDTTFQDYLGITGDVE